MTKKLLSAVFAIVLVVFVIAFSMTSYRYYQAIHSDDPIDPYLSVEQGNATITRGDIAIDMTRSESYPLREGDIVITHADSMAVITWPDRSTTRLGSNSRLTIERMRVASDYSKIELVAILEQGKVWSNIVRTLYPDSRIEFHLPKTGTVAGVRGTVFEINLDANYIHSVDHSVVLENALGTFITLMPGEAVRASNIFEKITTGLDSAWIALNQSKDILYTSVRNTQLRTDYNLLIGKTGASSIWDRLVRSVLSWVPSFGDLDVLATVDTGDLSHLSTNSQKMVLKWYQAFQSKDFVQERDQFRGIIMSMENTLINRDQILETLTRGAIWDSIDTSGALLKNTETLLDTYAKKTRTPIGDLLSGLRNIDTDRVTTESRTFYDKLFQ